MKDFYVAVDIASEQNDMTAYIVVKYLDNGDIRVVEHDYIKHSKMYIEKRDAINLKIDQITHKYNAEYLSMNPFTKKERKIMPYFNTKIYNI